MPRFRRFQHLSSLIRQLQLAGEVELRLVEEQGVQVMYMLVREPEDPLDPIRGTVAELRRVLGVSPDVDLIRVIGAAMKTQPDEIGLTSRSLLGVLKFLSPAHSRRAGPEPDDTHPGGHLLRLASGDGTASPRRFLDEPAAAGVHRRPVSGYWFSIDDADIDSKTTFSLLTYLFSLQATDAPPFGPILTLPTDR